MEANLKQQLEALSRGTFLNSEGKESWCFNFYDWFCSTSTLEKKARSLYVKVKKFLKKHPEIDTEKVYVFFKNNCPMVGPLYDDFRICDEDGVVFTVIPKCGHSGLAEVWGRDNDFKGPIETAKTFEELLK